MNDALIHALAPLANEGRERDFLCRVFQNGLAQYDDRIRAISFTGLDRILDAGAGMRQWSLSLTLRNAHVTALEPACARANIILQAARILQRQNLCCVRGSLDALPFAEASFDGVFSYSVIYLTHWRRSLEECVRVLRPGGRLYLNANGIGWLLSQIIKGGKNSRDFSSRRYAARSLAKTLSRGVLCPGADWALDPSKLAEILKSLGMEQVRYAGDGSLTESDAPPGKPFFPSRFLGCWSTFELLAVKP